MARGKATLNGALRKTWDLGYVQQLLSGTLWTCNKGERLVINNTPCCATRHGLPALAQKSHAQGPVSQVAGIQVGQLLPKAMEEGAPVSQLRR